MSDRTATGDTIAADAPNLREQLRPKGSIIYWTAAIFIFGRLAFAFSSQTYLHLPVRDLWQHLAALRALMLDPVHPDSPFLPGSGVSRHFHPYWLGMATLARPPRLEWDAIHLGAYFSLAVLAVGIYAFGRSYYRSSWGPVALLSAMLLAWLVPLDIPAFTRSPPCLGRPPTLRPC